jgi:ribosomal protein L34
MKTMTTYQPKNSIRKRTPQTGYVKLSRFNHDINVE